MIRRRRGGGCARLLIFTLASFIVVPILCVCASIAVAPHTLKIPAAATITPASSATVSATPVPIASPAVSPTVAAAVLPIAQSTAAPGAARSASGSNVASGTGNTATALCNDGTYSYAAHHAGACSQHKGVKVFYN